MLNLLLLPDLLGDVTNNCDKARLYSATINLAGPATIILAG
jgi:hypothetical protein